MTTYFFHQLPKDLEDYIFLLSKKPNDLYGWYSYKQHQCAKMRSKRLHGDCVIWRNEKKCKVICTEVAPLNKYVSKWSDAKCLGKVTNFVKMSSKPLQNKYAKSRKPPLFLLQ